MLPNYVNRNDDGVVEIFLYGDVGGSFDGNWLAQYINDCDKDERVVKIIERINTGGGSILNGMSLVSANLNCKTKLTTVNEGVAASMGALIFLTGGKREMKDYAKVMIHDPKLYGMSLEEMPEGKEKEGAKNLKDMLATIITNNCKLEKQVVENLMTEETWFSAEQCMEYGFCDKVINTGKNISLSTNILEAVNEANIYINKSEFHMKNLFNYLGLTEATNEDGVLNAVKAIETKRDSYKTQAADFKALLDTEKNKVSQLEAKIEADRTALEAAQNIIAEKTAALAEQVVTNAIQSGKFKAEDKESLVEMAKNNLEMFKTLSEKVVTKTVSLITNQIQNSNGVAEDRKDWDYGKWSKEDPKGLATMQKDEPQKFEKLLNEYVGE